MTELTKAQERVKTALASLIDMKHPVALAVETVRDEAIERAVEYAREKVKQVRKELKEAGHDLNKCAPYPDSGKLWGAAYHIALGKYRLFSSLTKWRKSSYSFREPHFADVNADLVEKFIKQNKKEAAFQYDAYVVKLCTKIGACDAAELQSNGGVWGLSVLLIKKGAGMERWRTQQIINQSKHGLLFNQWPSRKVKN